MTRFTQTWPQILLWPLVSAQLAASNTCYILFKLEYNLHTLIFGCCYRKFTCFGESGYFDHACWFCSCCKVDGLHIFFFSWGNLGQISLTYLENFLWYNKAPTNWIIHRKSLKFYLQFLPFIFLTPFWPTNTHIFIFFTKIMIVTSYYF